MVHFWHFNLMKNTIIGFCVIGIHRHGVDFFSLFDFRLSWTRAKLRCRLPGTWSTLYRPYVVHLRFHCISVAIYI